MYLGGKVTNAKSGARPINLPKICEAPPSWGDFVFILQAHALTRGKTWRRDGSRVNLRDWSI